MGQSRRFQPSLFDLVFMIWATVIPIALSGRLLNGDGDLPRHLRLGEWMLAHGALLRVDNFSYTMAGQPFVAFEWGSEVLYAAAYRVGGLAAVAVLAGLVLALTFALLVRFLLRRGAEPLLAYLVAMAAAILGAGHWLARPHLFTMLLVVVLLGLLERQDRRSLAWYLPLFALWTNLHGGFLYGLTLIGLYLAGDLIELRLSGGDAWRARARHHLAALGLAAAGAALNANGPAVFAHLVRFFGQPYLMEQTQEFHSPDFHVLNGKLFLAVLLVTIIGLAASRRRPDAPTLLVFLANTAFALQAQRNIELFALTALPLMALHLDAEWMRLPGLDRIRRAFAQEREARWRGVPALLIAADMIVLACLGGRIAGTQVIDNQFDPASFPVRAVAAAREAGLQGRLVSDFVWGGYVLKAWPEQLVFIDGGTDHYGEELLRQQVQLAGLEPGWRDVLSRWDISIALLGTDSRLAHELVREPGWSAWYCDSLAVVLRRGSAGAERERAVPGQCGPPFGTPPTPDSATGR